MICSLVARAIEQSSQASVDVQCSSSILHGLLGLRLSLLDLYAAHAKALYPISMADRIGYRYVQVYDRLRSDTIGYRSDTIGYDRVPIGYDRVPIGYDWRKIYEGAECFTSTHASGTSGALIE